MKSQEELYSLAEKTLDIMDNNSLKMSILNASRMTNVILLQAKQAEESHDLQFMKAALDVIQTYAGLLDETVDDIDAVVTNVRSNTIYAISEEEADEDTD